MPIARFDRTTPVAEVAAAVRADGAAIVERAVTPAVVAAVLAETEPYRSRTAMGTDSFSGRNTRRTGSLVARSVSVREMVMHPMVIGVCDAILGTNSTSYQLHVTQVIDIGPGEPAQFLHRDQWAWDTFPFPSGFDVEISTIWAMQDFTELNGATRVVPGSNTWPDDRRPGPDDSEPAEMPVGSVLIYSGSVFHGGGANGSDDRRIAVNIDYCLGWLRQEENQYLACPPEVARDLPVELARLLGYARGAYALGYFGDTQDPMEALHPATAGAAGFGGDVVAPRPVTASR
jgi:ectoine hydroxylase-related dioxygenase (phytanoyl-CoA dioxygenase family)